MSAQDQVTIMSARSNGGGGASTSAARVILQSSGPPINKIASQGPPPLTSIVLSTSAASKMLGSREPSSSNKVAELSSTKHRVKQLLETYSMTAEKSLRGPEEDAYSKFDQSYSGSNKAYGPPSYKLLPDVEISKTNNPNHSADALRREDVMKHLAEHGSLSASSAGGNGPSTENSNRLYLNKRNSAAISSQPQVTVRQDLVDNDPVKRDSTQNHQQMVSPAIAAAAAAMSANFHQNGLVTLSKIENPLHRSIQQQQSQGHGTASIDQRQAYMAVLQQQQAALREKRLGDSSRSQRLKSEGNDNDHVPALSPINGGPNGGVMIGNGGGRQHLTGEMIRQLRQHKEKVQAAGLLGGAKNSAIGDKHQLTSAQQQQMQAATYAAIQQHQMQMHAVYERALKEKSYLRNTTGHPSSTVVSGKGGNTYSNQQQAAIVAEKLSSQSSFKPPGATAGEMPPLSPISPVNVSRTGHPSSVHGGGVHGPVLSTRTDLHNPGHAKLQSTKLAGRGNIACFYIGGEARCCLPLILNSILDQISLHAINLSCDELQIYCSTCTPEQMDVLKNSAIIPISASQCGLITKSDAERLVSMLLDRNPPLASLSGFRAKSSPFSFRVEHSCFGDARGIVLPEAYTSATARCIECLECEGLFCPQKFVCHSHDPKNRTCHWGFDSDNWRAYLHLADDYTDSEREKLSKIVADFKNRYKPSSATTQTTKRKTIEVNSTNNATNSHSQHHPISRQELLSPSGSRQTLSPSGPPSKFQSQHETTTEISPTKKPRLSELNQSHDGPLQHHSIRSSNSHQNIPPLEALHADQGSYQSSRERERLGRDGNKSTEQPYSMYVYQQWAKMNPEAAANLEPSQAADLFNRAAKDGKVQEYSSGYGGRPYHRRSITEHDQGNGKRVSSLDRTTLRTISRSPNLVSMSHGAPDGPRSLSAERNYRDARMRGNGGPHTSASYIKSSPVSSIDDYSPTGKISPHETNTGPDSHRERLLPVDPNETSGRHRGNEDELMHSRGSNYTRRNSSKDGRASLADDIHSIRIALTGASATAKERTLKTLERLTARLALAESERDVALGELHDLQKRFRRVEDELQKKRAELREALRQDAIPIRRATPHSPSRSVSSRDGSTHHGYAPDHHLSGDGGRIIGNYNGSVRSQNDSSYRRYNHNPPPAMTRSGVTLELLSPGRDEDAIERDDRYRTHRGEIETEIIRGNDSPTRDDMYVASSGSREYQNVHRMSSSHHSRSHERHARTTSENERNHRSGSNHRSRSGSRESDNVRRTKERSANLQTRESHILRVSNVAGSHKVRLPKIDMQSPARVLEETDTINEDNEPQHTAKNSEENSRDALIAREELPYEEQAWEEGTPPLDRIKKAPKDNDIREGSRSPSPNQDMRPGNGLMAMPQALVVQRRTSCGTPVSEKSKDSEDLQDRMRSMEAELRALRNQLSHRSSSNNHNETKITSNSVQNNPEDLGNISDSHADETIHSRNIESPNEDINDDTDTSIEDKKLSIDLDKPSPQECGQQEGEEEEQNEKEDNDNSTAHNRHNNSNRCDIPLKKSADRQFSSDYNGSNGKHKHRNGKEKMSDNGNGKTHSDKETDSETLSTTNSREPDSDELSQSPIPTLTKFSKNDHSTIDSKDYKLQAMTNSKSYSSSNDKIESNGGKGHASSGISREQRQNPLDDKNTVSTNKKSLGNSLKVLVPPKKLSSYTSGSISSTTNRLHKSLKSDVNRGKDKTE